MKNTKNNTMYNHNTFNSLPLQAKQQLEILGYAPSDSVFIRCILPKDLTTEEAVRLGKNYYYHNKKRNGDVKKTHEFITTGLYKKFGKWEPDQGDVTVSQVNDQGFGVYFVVNPGGSSSNAITGARVLFFECDDISKAKQWVKIRALEDELGFNLFVVESGKSLHAYILIDQEITDLAYWTQLQKRLIRKQQSDPAIHNPDRLMRLAGFDHVKYINGEFVKTPVTIAQLPTGEATIEQIEKILPALEIKETEVKKSYSNRGFSNGDTGILEFVEYLDTWNDSSRCGWGTFQCPVHTAEETDRVHSVDHIHVNLETGAFKAHCGCDPSKVFRLSLKEAIENGYVPPTKEKLKQERKQSFTEAFKGFCGLGSYVPTHVQNSSKFELPPITKPLTFISSACKTGKTSALIEEVRARMNAGYRVIWITYRNSLAFQTCEKLGIPHVHEFNSDPVLVSGAKAFACCPDSLHLLNLSAIKERFFVVIDEADATLAHILKGETMGEQHEAKLEHFLKFVNRVITWDGNIVMMEDSLSAGLLDAYRKMFGTSLEYDFFLNTKYVSQYPVTLGSGSVAGLLQAITRDLENGKRVIFVSDAQEKLESYHHMLNNMGINTHIIRVDSTTVDEDHVKQFVATPDSCIEAAKYGLIMISPTAESGLSITHPDIDVVYGYFTHSQPRQIIQMLERYRLDVPRKIYVREFCPEAKEIKFMNPVEVLAHWQAAHEDTIKRVQLETREFRLAIDEQLDTTIQNLQIQREDSTQRILNENLAWFKARDNAAKANLLENLTLVLTERGHAITPIKWEFDKDLNDELKIAVDEIRDDKGRVIADAPDDGRGYEQAKKDLESHSLNKEEQAICKKIVLKHQLPGYDVENYKAVRYVIERRGRNRKRVENFYHVIAPQVAKEKDRRSLVARLSQRSLQMLHHSPNRVRSTGAFALLYDALIQPIITGGEYTNNTPKIIELNQILVAHAEQFKDMTGLTFKPCQEQIKDSDGKIIQQAITPVTNVNKLLKWLGLNPTAIKRGGSDGARQRVYKVLPSEFFYETLAALVARDSEMLEDADRYNTSAVLNRVIQLLKTADVNGTNPYVDSTGKLILPDLLGQLVEKTRQKMSINTH